MAFNLITKQAGSVTHKIDGAYQAQTRSDCILNGCAFSATGNKLTIGSGKLMMCGRIIEVDAPTQVTVPVTGSVASVVFKIEDDELSIETSASVPETLQQEDINADGNVYECIIAVCSVLNDAITDITSHIGASSPFGGVIYGTEENPPEGFYADGTIYIQYE